MPAMLWALILALGADPDVSPPAQGLHPKTLDHVRKCPLPDARERTKPLALAVSPSGQFGAVVNAAGKVFVLDLETGKLAAQIDGKNAQAAAFGRDNLLAIGTQRGGLVLCGDEKLKTQKAFDPMPSDQTGISALLFSPSGRLLAVQDNARLALVDVGEPRTIVVMTLPSEQVAGWAFDASERRLFVALEQGKVKVVDTSDGNVSQEIAKPPQVVEEKLEMPAIEPTGRFFAYRSGGRIRVFNTAGGARVEDLEPPLADAVDVQFLENGGYLAAFSHEEIRVWSTSTWKMERSLTVLSNETELIAAAAGTNRLVSVDGGVSTGSTIRVWGLRAKKEGDKRKAFLGVSWTETGGKIMVTRLYADSPAFRGGLKEEDIVVEVAGAKIDSIEAISAELLKHAEGDVVDIVVERAGKRETLKVTLGARIE